MKSIVPHQFQVFASKFTLESMIEQVSICAVKVFKSGNSDFGSFAKREKFEVAISKDEFKKGQVLVIQTRLIDLIYTLVCLKQHGTNAISTNETLYLISLFNDYYEQLELKHIKENKKSYFPNNILLHLYGSFGEQKRFQSLYLMDDEFCREKYILDKISKRNHPSNIYNIDILREFEDETQCNTTEFSAFVYFATTYLSAVNPIFKFTDITARSQENNSVLLNIKNIIKRYSCSIKDVQQSPFGRQFFYSKPIIQIDDKYISANPFLLCYLFVNSNYWIIRNRYKEKKNSLHFINAFGAYFELYVEEILENCLQKHEYIKIPPSKEKRADWHLNLCGFNFLIEQKSSLSLLEIKQSLPDYKKMRSHILKNWGEAVNQLNCTHHALHLNNPIKIILVYEDYFKSECLDELFIFDSSLQNDKKYWLMTIREFEMLLITYKDNPKLFKKIIEAKDEAELCCSKNGREMIQFLNKYDVRKNTYLERFGILHEFDQINKNINDILNSLSFKHTFGSN